MNLSLGLTTLMLVLCPALAQAQFQQVRATANLSERIIQTKVCDTSAFPPFNRHGPWRFDLCNRTADVVERCHILASVRAKQVLPSPMLRRALLRLIEEFEAGTGIEQAVHSALTLNCESVAQAPG